MEILYISEINNSNDNDFFMVYIMEQSCEADSWINYNKENSNESIDLTFPTCFLNAGYSQGCISMILEKEIKCVEVACKAMGSSHCKFLISTPEKIEKFIANYLEKIENSSTLLSHFLNIIQM